MKVIVIGGGVIGTTTVHSLRRAGAEVVLAKRYDPEDRFFELSNRWLS